MGNVTWWKKDSSPSRKQDEPASGGEEPGDENATDIVGRTGEEMPDVAHDDGGFDLPMTPDEETDDGKPLTPAADEFER